MNVRDIRIGDFVSLKTNRYNENRDDWSEVVSIHANGVEISTSDRGVVECSDLDLQGIRVTDNILRTLGGTYYEKKVEYIFNFSGGLRISIRPQLGADNYIASVIGQYRSPFCRFSHIHTLQHWLWDMFKTDI